MINYTSQRQMSIEDFRLPFAGKLDASNRWVRLAEQLPWDDLVTIYARGLSKDQGRPTTDLRVELGVLLLQEMLNTSDEETIAQVRENPYLQFFLGYSEYEYRRVFDPSLMVTIRRRLDRERIAELPRIATRHWSRKKKPPTPPGPGNDDGDSSGGTGAAKEDSAPSADNTSEDTASSEPKNKGRLLLDATAAEMEIPYPTDAGLLNEAREQSERLIDILWEASGKQGIKPRT